jgi:hypothetical protein
MKLLKNKINTLGIGLAQLYSWNQAVDVEAQQVLLCIKSLSDENGYAQVAEVRKTVGVAADRMTRCMRMLQGQKKSQSMFKGLGSQRQPLIDTCSYTGSPTVARVCLTNKGDEIVEKLIGSCHREMELEAMLEKQSRMLKQVECMGFDIDEIERLSTSSMDQLWYDRSNAILKAVMNDLSQKKLSELLDLNMPSLSDKIKILGYANAKDDDENFQRTWLFTLYNIKKVIKQ